MSSTVQLDHSLNFKLPNSDTLNSVPLFVTPKISRHSVSIFGAGLITLALLMIMRGLIAEEFKPQDTAEHQEFLINPKIEDIPLDVKLEAPKLPEAIDIPPAPPPLGVPAPTRPADPIHQPIPQPTFKLSKLPFEDILPSRIDTDPTPLVRVPPAMPTRATRSGHCQVGFDISAEGRPFNVRTLSCSERLFSRPAIKAVEKWVYRPEIREGRAITRTGLKTVIRFQLTDEAGRLIPE